MQISPEMTVEFCVDNTDHTLTFPLNEDVMAHLSEALGGGNILSLETYGEAYVEGDEGDPNSEIPVWWLACVYTVGDVEYETDLVLDGELREVIRRQLTQEFGRDCSNVFLLSCTMSSEDLINS
jgi:hypothetical protein